MKRIGPNTVTNFSHGLKGLLGNIASLMFYPPILIAAIHKFRGVQIKNIKKVFFSFNVLIDNMVPEHVHLGEDVWLTRNVTVLAHFNPSEAVGSHYNNELIVKDVYIEDGVFIGVNSVILPGVRIGKNSVIGAGSVVTKDVPPNVIVAGNPAKVIKSLEAEPSLAGV